MFQNKKKISLPELLVSPGEQLQIFKKMCFICQNKRTGDNNTYNEDVCKVDCTKESLTEWSKYYGKDKSSRFYEALSTFR